MVATKSIFSDALRQTERRTWELWDAVQTSSREIAEAKRSEKITGTKVDVKKMVEGMVGDYAGELIPTITDQIEEYAKSDTTDTFYLKAQTMENFLTPRTLRAPVAPTKTIVGSDTLAFYGGAVKAMGGGRIQGYGVLHSSASDPDLQKEFFTKATEYMLEVGDSRPVLYRHGIHPQLKARILGKAAVTSIDDVGVFFEGELNLRDKYEKAIYRLAELGKLGFSTGSMTHLVEKEIKEHNGNKAAEIKTWPIGELSLTPAPVEARTVAVAVPIKDMVIDDEELDFDSVVKSTDQEQYDQQFSIDGIPSIKAFCEAVSPTSLKDGSHRSESAANAVKEFITITKVLGEAYDSYGSRLVKRTEHRFLQQGREIDPSTTTQVEKALSDLGRVKSAFAGIEDSLQGIRKLSEMSKADQKAMDLKARNALWNYYRISGHRPEELENG